MKVRLISYTKPVADLPCRDLKELVTYCARVSNPANQANNETAQRLIDYCIRNKHWSIFEQASMCLEIETTRDIGRQILRHRSLTFEEHSQRYATVDELGFEFREARLQDPKNRQNSIKTDDAQLGAEWQAQQAKALDACRTAYSWALDNGLAKEVARAVLPEGMTRTRMYVTGTIRSWIHFCELRAGHGTQSETSDIARACARILTELLPIELNIDAEPH